jgi:hypothetical protein
MTAVVATHPSKQKQTNNRNKKQSTTTTDAVKQQIQNFKQMQRTFCKKTGTSSFLFGCFFTDIFDVGAGTMAVGSETSLGRVGLLTMLLG